MEKRIENICIIGKDRDAYKVRKWKNSCRNRLYKRQKIIKIINQRIDLDRNIEIKKMRW